MLGRPRPRLAAVQNERTPRQHTCPVPRRLGHAWEQEGSTGLKAKASAEQLIALVKDGASLAEAGRQFGVSRERVRQILKREGIEVSALPDRPEAKARRRRNRVREHAEVFEAMWRKGATYGQIARALGFSASAVREVIHERVPYEQRLKRAATKHSNRSRIPDDWALQALRDAARLLGRTPSCRAYERLRAAGLIEGPAVSLITTRLGWCAACRLAGLEPNARAGSARFGSRLYSNDDLRAALERVTQLLGEPPSVSEYEANRHEDEPTAATIRSRHGGSWLEARARLLGPSSRKP